jgi:HEAT repeat protein
MKGRGRTAAMIAVAAGIPVIIAAGWCFRGLAVEEWSIYRLGSKDPAERDRAIERLEEMLSVRAIPRLLEVLPNPRTDESVGPYIDRCGNAAARPLEDFLMSARPEQPWRFWAAGCLISLRPESDVARQVLLEALSDRDAERRAGSFDLLEHFGIDTVPRLAECLKNGNLEVRRWATSQLEEIGPAAIDAAGALEDAMGDPARLIVTESAVALAEIGAPADRVLPALVKGIQSGEPTLPTCAASGFKNLGREARPAIPALIAMLGWDKEHSDLSVSVFASIGPDAVGPLIAVLGESDVARRRGALEALSKLGRKASGAEGAIRSLLDDPDPVTVALAAEALFQIDGKTDPAEVVPSLCRVIRDPEASEEAIFRALRIFSLWIGEDALPALPAILESCLPHSDPEVRRFACGAIGCMGPEAKEAIPGLVKALKGPDRLVYPAAAFALFKMGAAAKKAIPSLEEAARTGAPAVRPWAAAALIAIDPTRKDSFLPEIMKSLQDQKDNVKVHAAKALRNLRGMAREAAPELVKLTLHGTGKSSSAATAQALDVIEPSDKDLRPIIEALREGSGDAARALCWIERAALMAIPELTAALRNPDSDVREAAARALGNLGPEARSAAGALRERLRDRRKAVRRAAREALAKILGEG